MDGFVWGKKRADTSHSPIRALLETLAPVRISSCSGVFWTDLFTQSPPCPYRPLVRCYWLSPGPGHTPCLRSFGWLFLVDLCATVTDLHDSQFDLAAVRKMSRVQWP